MKMEASRALLTVAAVLLLSASAMAQENADRAAQLVKAGIDKYLAGDTEGAMQSFSGAIAAKADYPRAAYGKSALFFIRGDFEASRAVLQEYMNRAGEDDPYAWLLAYIAMARAENKQDLAMLNDVEATNEPHTQFAETLQMYLGRLSPAQYIEDAGNRLPEGGRRDAVLRQAHFFAGEYLLITGDKDAARAHFEACGSNKRPLMWEREMAKSELQRLAAPRQ